MRRAPLLASALLLASTGLVRAAEQKTDIAAPTAGGASVDANTTMSDAEATQRLGAGHHIRDTRRVKIGSLEAKPDGGKQLQPKPGAGMQAAASAGQPGAGQAPQQQTASAGAPGGGPVAPPQGADGPVTDATLSPTAKVMLGGTPTDFRSDRQRVVAGIGQAANAWNLGDFKNVIIETNKALAVDPRNADALGLQARAYEKMRDYADAEQDLRRAVAVDTADVSNWEHLAWAAYKQNKAQDALDAARSALARNPDDAAALAIKAYAEDALGQKAQAAADIDAAAKLDGVFASRAARAKSGDRLCEPEEELVDAGPRRGGRGGLPTWLPWVGGAMLVGLGLTFALAGALRGQEAPAESPPAGGAPPSGAA